MKTGVPEIVNVPLLILDCNPVGNVPTLFELRMYIVVPVPPNS